jgi:tetratricopeptide (TPR) repeat protein
MRMRCLLPTLIVAAVFVVSPLAAQAAAPSDFPKFFASGVRLYKDMDFERALEQFQLARTQPHGAAEEVQAALYAGILHFELGNEAQAQELFRLAASLDPQAPLPVKVSPRIEIAYEKERAKFAALMQQAAPPPGTPPVALQPVYQVGQAPQPQPQAVRNLEPVAPVATRAGAAQSSGPGGKKVAGGVVLGLGAAAAIVGGAAYGLAWANYPKYQRNEASRAEAEQMDLDAKLGLGLLIAGAATAVVGIVLLALPDGTSATASFSPLPGGAAFAVRGTLP